MLNELKAWVLRKLSSHSKDASKLFALRKTIAAGGLLRVIRVLKYNRICYKNNCFIPMTATIGANTAFPHGLCGIFISQGAAIGDNCTIFHQVTIGSNTLADSKTFGAPMIGNDVYIGAGAKIIGRVKIGNNVRIGANTVVATDIPDNATVVTERPRIIVHDGERPNKYVGFKSDTL